jgi:hypothetical protein
VNWADLSGVDVEVSLLDGIVTVTIEEAAPGAVELCRFVSEELELSWRACSMATCRPRAPIFHRWCEAQFREYPAGR